MKYKNLFFLTLLICQNLFGQTQIGSDVDGDLDYFELYLDKTDASTFIKQIDAISTTSETNIEVQSETAYSWKVIAVDSNGNKSDSGIYTFRTD